MNDYLTAADGARFVRIEDFDRVAEDTAAALVAVADVENSVTDRLSEIHSTITGRLSYIEDCSIKGLRNDILEIKQALIEVQDMLRFLGMDDIGKRLGDLDTLLA